MKIAVLTNLYPPISRGGAEKVVQRIVAELLQRGHEVVVISTMSFSGLSSLEPVIHEALGEKVYRFFPLNLYHVLNDHKHPYFLRAIWHAIDLFSSWPAKQIEKILVLEKPDLVLTHNLKGLGLRSPLAIKNLRLPWVHTVHDVQLSVPSGLLMVGEKKNLLERFLRRPYEILVQRVIGEPNLVLSPSKFLAGFYQQRGFFKNTEVRVLPNPVPDFPLSSRGIRSPGPLRLLFAGQLERHKGIFDLLEAVNLLEIPVELHVAGSGTYASLVQKQSAKDKRIIYHGFVSTNSLENLFSIIDAVVVPSRCLENSPTIIYESLQSGVPVIASDIGGLSELIQHGNNGYLIEPGNVQSLVKIIKSFTDEVVVFHQRYQAIQASVAAYSLKSYVDHLEVLMTNLVKEKK
ncbi:MAG: glycosyltransferase family 4 protein [Candidatus Uhrbacteria bacterium]